MSDLEIRRFEILPLLDDIKINDKIPIQITCIEVSNDDVYLGTADSFILLYHDLFDNISSTTKPYYKYLGLKKPITQMKALSVLNRLLCLCDHTLIVTSLENLEIINSFKVKNVSTFCLNQNPISMDPFNVELCLAKRKSLTIALCYSDKMTTLKEVNAPEQPIVMAMDGHYVCMASIANYFMINWESASSQILCENSSETFSLPICKYISRDEFLINGPSYLGVFVMTSGISQRPPINWGPNVLQIAYSYPYILCLKSHSISIISVIDQKVKDEFLLENGVHIDNFDGKIVVASKESLFLMNRISWEEQIDSLLLNEKCQEAIDLYHNLCQNGMIGDNEISDYGRNLQIKAGLIELNRKKFDQAKQFLIDGQFEIDRLFNLNENLVKKLKIENSNNNVEETNEDIQKLTNKIKNSLEINVINDFLLSYIKEILEECDKNTFDVNLVNTAKLFIYLDDISNNITQIKSFLQNESVHNYGFELVENYLKDQNHHYFLALLYSVGKFYEKSIEIFENLEKNIIQDNYYPGIDELYRLLKKCHNSQLILKHIDFILERNQIEGAKILIANTKMEQNQYTILNPELVITILHKYREALVIYLEYLIYQMKIKTPHLHTTLVIIYIEILSLQKENEEQGSKLYEEIRIKLKEILEQSDYYDKQMILQNLTKNGMDYETAFLYGKMGEHWKTFEIYLGQYLDYEQALRHCIKYGYNDGGSKNPRIFQTLMTFYLDLYEKNGPEVMKPLLEFLNHSKCDLDLEKTLMEIPMDWPLKLMERYISNNFNRKFDSKFQTSFGRVLSLSMLERVKQKKRKLLNNPIKIDKERLLEPRFVWIPSNQQVVHDFCYYSCINNNNTTTTNSNININDNDINLINPTPTATKISHDDKKDDEAQDHHQLASSNSDGKNLSFHQFNPDYPP